MSSIKLEVMSLSKVAKNSGEFVPEKLLPHDFEDRPIWGPITKRIETDGAAADSKNTHIDPAPSAKAGEQPFDSDFSAPETHIDTPTIPVSKEPDGTVENPPVEEKVSQEDLDAAVEKAYNSGVQAGMERMESDHGLSVKTLQSICEQLSTIRETILKNSMSELRELVLLISEKIIRHSIASQKDTIIQTVDEAIHHAVKSDEFIIYVNPDDYITIKTKSSDFISSVSGLENIIVQSDATIDRGGCLIESSNCTVDATLASQLEVIAESLQE